MVKQKTHPKTGSKEELSSPRELVLHNDDFNTFDFVISSLIEVCKHEAEQAEQCAMIVHYKGKCTVKTGPFAELEPMYKELGNRGLTVTIEE
jgi:ATP-dependent Clp protease adaptor protein ClpS